MSGSGTGEPDIAGMASQWIQEAMSRILQNNTDLGLAGAGQNWTGRGWPQGGPDNATASFPAGTPFAGTTPGFPPGTPGGTLPTATSTDLSSLNLQAQGAFAPVIDAQNQINAQAQAGASGAGGLLAGLGGGGSGLASLGALAA